MRMDAPLHDSGSAPFALWDGGEPGILSRAYNPGCAFIVERDGSLIGTSQGSASFSSPLCKGKARAVQINCMATDVPVPGDVARACKQLQVRAGGFVTDYFAGTVGHGANGRIILRAAQITDPSVTNLDWLCVISLNFDAFIHVGGLLSFMVVFCILHTMRSAPTMVALVVNSTTSSSWPRAT